LVDIFGLFIDIGAMALDRLCCERIMKS